ncbi:hypothetical protein A0H81_07506 [Grifola frondosa]|uniref:ARID domain-containing protein n=1 Tax=Grifola frondosa TaxID=5627 RepID=A0A1C7M665_GRIFR|nr:hypothetical protein A0H81_07506 [Grifola frondosa]
MADRIPQQYTPIHNNFLAGLAAQQGMSQQQPQLDPQQNVPALAKSDLNRMWHLQQQQQLQQQQFRNQAGGGMAPQANSQMMDFMRSQGLARMQQQQQMAQKQQQQQQQIPFMGPPQMSASASSSGFPHEPQPHRTCRRTSPTPFPGGGHNFTALQLQALAAQNPQMFQALQSQDGQLRQLGLMRLAQTQQKQNNLMHLQQQQQAHQQQQQHAQQQSHQQQQLSMGAQAGVMQGQVPPGFFTGSTIPTASDGSHGSPGAANLPANMQQANIAGHSRAMVQQHNAQQLQQHQQHQSSIKDLEQKNAVLGADHLNKPDAVTAQIQINVDEIARRRAFLSKLAAMMQQVNNTHAAAMAATANASNRNPAAPSPVQAQRLAVSPNNIQGAAGWISQQGSSPMLPSGTPQSQNIQGTTPQMAPQVVAAQMNARGVKTPLPMLNPGSGGQPVPHASPNMMAMQQFPQKMAGPSGAPSGGLPLSLEAGCSTGSGMLQFESRQISLHMLHAEVLNVGGAARATQADQWPIIGANLGFVQFPGSETEPAKCGPGVAQHLQHVYREFLMMFDNAYIMSINKRRHQSALEMQAMQANQQAANMAQNAPMQSAQAQNNGAPVPPPNVPQFNGVPSLPGLSDPKLINELVNLSASSSAELRRRGIPQNIIDTVENHRPRLQEARQQQHDFRNRLAQNVQPPNGAPQQRIADGQLMNPRGQPAIANTPNPLLGMRPGQHAQHAVNQPTPVPPNAFGDGGSQMQNNSRGPLIQMRPRPTLQDVENCSKFVQNIRAEYHARSVGQIQPQFVPDNQRLEYNTAFEQMWRYVHEVESKLHMYACFIKEDAIRKLIAMVTTANQQRELLSSGTPKYIMNLDMIRAVTRQMQTAKDAFTNFNVNPPPENSSHGFPAPPPGGLAGPPAPHPQRPIMPPQQLQPPQSIPQPSTIQPLPVQPPTVQSIPSIPAPPPAVPQQPPHPKKKQAAPPAESIATSTPPASTPAANAPTPTHVAHSPRTPKSPRTKAASKPKPAPRRKASKVTSTPTVAPATIPAPAAAPQPASASASTSAHAFAPTPVPASVSTPAPAPTPDVKPSTPAATPGGNVEVGTKRPREEELPSSSTSIGAPPAKKIKKEWTEPPSDVFAKRQEEADSIKTEDDATKFFEQMSDLLKMVSSGEADEGQEQLTMEIAGTLKEILKAYPTPPDPSDGDEFFDFSLYGIVEDDAGSKAATPDLMQTASIGPSPGSASETDGAGPSSSTVLDTAKIADPKSEEIDGADSLRHNMWREIDGGEAGYYNYSDTWKWDTPMPPAEQPWAIYNL